MIHRFFSSLLVVIVVGGLVLPCPAQEAQKGLPEAQEMVKEIKALQEKAQGYSNELNALNQEYQTAEAARKQEIESQSQLKSRSLSRLSDLLKEKQNALFDLASSLILEEPASSELRLIRSEAGYGLGKMREVAEDLASVPLEALDVDHLMILAQANESLGHFERAIESYQKALGFMEDYQKPYCLNQIAQCNFNAQNFEKAAELYGQLLDMAPEEQKNHFSTLKQSAAQYVKLYERELALREKEAQENNNPLVVLQVDAGEIKLELFEDQAPNTVANFISLVESNFYDGLIFHRVIPQFMIQTGCPDGTGQGGPGYRFEDECRQADARKHFLGSLSMANSGPNTNGSQFFITMVVPWWLNNKHTVFGRVVDGMDAVFATKQGDKIISAKVIRKRDHAYEVNKLPADQ